MCLSSASGVDVAIAYIQGVNLMEWASQAQPPSIRKSDIEAHGTPLPPLAIPRQIVTELEAERKRTETKIKAWLAEVCVGEATFPA